MTVFVDTSVWFSALVSEDANNQRCSSLLTSLTGRLLTTDFVIDELITLLTAGASRRCAAGRRHSARRASVNIYWLQQDDFYAGWEISCRFSNCTSCAAMQRLGITEALSLDDHFRQFGFVAVRP